MSPSHASRKLRGTQRERAVKAWYEERDFVAFRAPASLGFADVIAMRKGTISESSLLGPLADVHFVECKSTAGGPYEHFRPEARKRLRNAAIRAGAEAWLAWWPSRGELKFIHSDDWP